MTARSSSANGRAARRAARLLRRADRLDEVGEALAVLLVTSARLVDDATGPQSDVVASGRAQVIRAHAQILAQLAEQVGPVPVDQFDQFLASLSVPAPGVTDAQDRRSP